MQGRRLKRRESFLLAVLIFLSITTWLYAKRGWIFDEFKHSIEKTLSRQLHAQVKIGRFDGGFLRKISFRDLSISDEAKDFLVLARRAYFNFRLWDILFKKYKSLDQISLEVNNVEFFRGDFHFPCKISHAEASLRDGILEIRNLHGYVNPVRKGKALNPALSGNREVGLYSSPPQGVGLSNGVNGEIPFELKATIEQLSGDNPKIEINCRFLSTPPCRKMPLFLPAVIYLNGDLHRLFLKGSWDALDKSAFDIEGDIRTRERKFNFVISPPPTAARWTEGYLAENIKGLSSTQILERPSKIVLSGDFSQTNRLNIKLSLDHLRFRDNELLSNIFVESEFVPQQNLLQGRIYSSGSVLNYLPLPEFEGFYKLKGGRLRISSLKWADSLLLSGSLNFIDVVSGNLLVSINNFNLANFAMLYYPHWNSWGIVDGKVKLDIGKKGVITQGNINFSEGALGPFEFKGGRIQFEGQDSLFKVKESRVYQGNGYLDITGEVNLKKLGKPDFGKKLVLISHQDNINWQGWSVSRKDDASGIAVDKGIDDKFSIGFRSYMRNYVGMLDDKRDEFDLEYKLKEDKSLKIRLKENEELLGVEHKVRF